MCEYGTGLLRSLLGGGPDTRPPDVNSENENVRANFPAE
jgi:hypothetical protein